MRRQRGMADQRQSGSRSNTRTHTGKEPWNIQATLRQTLSRKQQPTEQGHAKRSTSGTHGKRQRRPPKRRDITHPTHTSLLHQHSHKQGGTHNGGPDNYSPKFHLVKGAKIRSMNNPKLDLLPRHHSGGRRVKDQSSLL